MIRMRRELAVLAILFAVLGPSHASAYGPEDILFSAGSYKPTPTVFVADGKVFCDMYGPGNTPIPISGYDLQYGVDQARYYFESISTVIFYIDGGTDCPGGTWVALDLMRYQATELKLKGPPCEEVLSIQVTSKDNFSLPRAAKYDSVEMRFTQTTGTVTKIVFRRHRDPVVK